MIVESFILGFREEYGSWNTMFTSRRTARSSDVDRRRSENRSAMASTRSVAPAARACSYSASSESGTSKRTSPSVGFSSRMRQRPTVPLPDPVPPSRPQTCSFWIFRPTSATAFSEVVARNAPRTGKNLLSPYAAIIMLLPLVEPAGDQLIIPLPEVDRHDTVALFKSEGTSGVEGAPRRRGAPYTPDVPSLLKDRKSTRLNSSPSQTSYAVFCLKKKIRCQRKERKTTRAACGVPRTPIPSLVSGDPWPRFPDSISILALRRGDIAPLVPCPPCTA